MSTHGINCDCLECGDPHIQTLYEKFNKANVIDHAGNTMEHYAKYFPDIQWNTEPLLANPLLFWRDWWDAATWIKWHGLVKAKYGTDRANEVLIEWFKKAPFASPTTDYRSFDDNFIKYAKATGFYDALFGGILGKVVKTGTQVIKTGEKVVESAGNLVENTGEGIEKIGDVFGFLTRNAWWIISLVSIIIIYVMYKKAERS